MNEKRFTHTKVRLLTWYNPDPPMTPITTIRFRSDYNHYTVFFFDDIKIFTLIVGHCGCVKRRGWVGLWSGLSGNIGLIKSINRLITCLMGSGACTNKCHS